MPPCFKWTAVAPLKHPRRNPIGVPLDDGRVLVAGGQVAVFSPRFEIVEVTAVEVWDPRRNRWSAGDKLLGPEGKFVGVKGLHWDGAVGKWKKLTHLPSAHPPERLTLSDGATVSAGGPEWKGGKPYGKRETAHAKVQLRPRRGRPQPAPLKEARIEAMLTEIPGGRVLVTGGYQTSLDYSWDTVYRSVGQVEVLDLERGVGDDGGTLVRARHGHAAVLLPEGSVLLVGGRHDESRELPHVELGRPE